MRPSAGRSLLCDRLPMPQRQVLLLRVHANRSRGDTARELRLTLQEVQELERSGLRMMLGLPAAATQPANSRARRVAS